MSSVPRTRTGCQSCRVRHLKCDEQRPSCSRCAKSGIECIRGFNIRFRHSLNPSVANLKGSGLTKCEYDFAENQPWCKTSHSLSFVDETKELKNIYDHDDSDSDDAVPVATKWPQSRHNSAPELPPSVPPPSAAQPLRLSRKSPLSTPSATEPASSPKRRRLSAPYPSDAAFSASPGFGRSTVEHRPAGPRLSQPPFISDYPAADSLLVSAGDFPSLESTSSIASGFAPDFSSISNPSPSLQRTCSDPSIWPLKEKEEAELLRYYIENLASSLDLCDQNRHFQLVVPQRASICPALLNAILALSAKHWSRVGTYDPYVADRYHSECLKYLIPMLDDSEAIMDENLLAATTILRFMEEIDVPISGTESQGHLFGTHVFISAQERSTVFGGLRQAAFWVGLRQEIYMAFVNQRSIMPVLEHCNIDRSFEPADDCTWANRIVTHCADVLRYCFGDGEQTIANYNRLLEYCEGWYMFKPASFAPIFYKEPHMESNAFPEIWLLSDAVTTGMQHYHLARILLTAHNPKIPKLGPGQKQAAARIDIQIKDDVRTLCGMANSNARCPPNFVTASMAIALAGERFDNRREQEAIMELLVRCERDHAWPTLTARVHLKEAWGWEADPPLETNRVSIDGLMNALS